MGRRHRKKRRRERENRKRRWTGVTWHINDSSVKNGSGEPMYYLYKSSPTAFSEGEIGTFSGGPHAGKYVGMMINTAINEYLREFANPDGDKIAYRGEEWGSVREYLGDDKDSPESKAAEKAESDTIFQTW